MITLELLRIQDDRLCDAELAIRIRANGSDVSIEGPEPELIDLYQPVLNLRNGTTITCNADPEEWVRGLAAAFRTPYLAARIVEDTNPLPDVRVAPASVVEPAPRF